jgi:hypothetical protein
MRELHPDEIPIAFAFPTLHYVAAGESVTGLEQPPLSGLEYQSKSDEGQAVTEGVTVVNSAGQMDTRPVVPQGPWPWLAQQSADYVPVPPPAFNAVARAPRFFPLDVMGVVESCSGSKSGPVPEPEGKPFLLPRDACQGDLSENNSDIFMNAPSSSGSDQDIELGTLGMDLDMMMSIGALVAPDLPDNSDEEIPVGNFGREGLETQAEDSPEEDDEEIEVGNLGLVASESDEEIEVGNLGLATGMWAESNADDVESWTRARVRDSLPRVDPVTGLYTAESFSNVPNEWID